jgi:hypothetical protein
MNVIRFIIVLTFICITAGMTWYDEMPWAVRTNPIYVYWPFLSGGLLMVWVIAEFIVSTARRHTQVDVIPMKINSELTFEPFSAVSRSSSNLEDRLWGKLNLDLRNTGKGYAWVSGADIKLYINGQKHEMDHLEQLQLSPIVESHFATVMGTGGAIPPRTRCSFRLGFLYTGKLSINPGDDILVEVRLGIGNLLKKVCQFTPGRMTLRRSWAESVSYSMPNWDAIPA